jgi:hypothetical protein
MAGVAGRLDILRARWLWWRKKGTQLNAHKKATPEIMWEHVFLLTKVIMQKTQPHSFSDFMHWEGEMNVGKCSFVLQVLELGKGRSNLSIVPLWVNQGKGITRINHRPAPTWPPSSAGKKSP